MLRSENLTISVPNEGCNKNCPYCISRMTGYTHSNWPLIMRNINKVKTNARTAGITNILLTGKGEPLLSLYEVESLARSFGDEFPVEIQTNGLLLLKDFNAGQKFLAENIRLPRQHTFLYEKLHDWGIDIVAISVDRKKDFKRFVFVIKEMQKIGLTVRLTINISNMMFESWTNIFSEIKKLNVNQVLIRKLSIPEYGSDDSDVVEWIEMNAPEKLYNNIVHAMDRSIKSRGRHIRTLNTGEKVYDLDGVSVVGIDYCIQENSDGNDIRSLIFHEDGHLYTMWNSEASRLF